MRVHERSVEEKAFVKERDAFYRKWTKQGLLDLNKYWSCHEDGNKVSMVHPSLCCALTTYLVPGVYNCLEVVLGEV